MTLQGRNYEPRPKPEKEPKKEPVPLNRTAIKKGVSKMDPLMPVYMQVWEDRLPGSEFVPREYESARDWHDHTSKYQVCSITYEPIFEPIIHNFLHVLTKRHRRWRNLAMNIVLGTPESHQIQEFQSKESLIAHGPGGVWFLAWQEIMKTVYESYEPK